MQDRVVLYSAVDAALTRYEVDVAAATLVRRDAIVLPAKVQYAWPHPSRPVLYAATSSAGPRVRSEHNHVVALAVAPDGALSPFGEPVPLPRRAVHLCVDPGGRYVLGAHNLGGGGVTVHRLAEDGAIGEAVPQDPALNLGLYPHQVRVFPSGRAALIVDRGNKAQEGRPEDPGALRVFPMADGVLSPGPVSAPGGGYGFGPRHADFHPTRPWLYVSDERTNRLYMFRLDGDRPEPEPAYALSTLADGRDPSPRQLGGPIHVHPNGRFVYVANRADGTVRHEGRDVFDRGENSIAVFAIDPGTGEPRLVQHAPTGSFHVRTFALDPAGRLLVAASVRGMLVREGGTVRPVGATLSLLRVGEDGRLSLARTSAVETPDGAMQYWMGIPGRR